jgi:tripartite-type tricarboxylate transporter receptor subunit TctC
MMRFVRTALLVLTAPLALQAGASWAQSFPARPIRLLVPSTPGGSVDTLARAVAPKLSEKWGQQVVIDNRAGAGGVIAAETVAKAPADGYTLMLGTVSSLATNVTLHKKLPYDPLKDFAPVSLLATQQLMLLVNPSVPAKNVQELIALARAKPGELTHSSAGNGTGSHLSAELFKAMTKTDMVHVPYKGVAPGLLDVVSGRVTMTFATLASALPQVRSGKLRALAVTGAKRSPAAPEVPTIAESSITGYEASTWYGVVAPAATLPAIVDTISTQLAHALKAADVRDRLSHEGMDLAGSTPAQFRQFMASEIQKWSRLIKARGIQAG